MKLYLGSQVHPGPNLIYVDTFSNAKSGICIHERFQHCAAASIAARTARRFASPPPTQRECPRGPTQASETTWRVPGLSLKRTWQGEPAQNRSSQQTIQPALPCVPRPYRDRSGLHILDRPTYCTPHMLAGPCYRSPCVESPDHKPPCLRLVAKGGLESWAPVVLQEPVKLSSPSSCSMSRGTKGHVNIKTNKSI